MTREEIEKYCQCKYPLIRVDPFNKEYCGICDNYFEEIKPRKMKPITPQELRIGNKLQKSNGEIYTVLRIDNTKDVLVEEQRGLLTLNYNLYGIELTKEILLRLGYKYIFELIQDIWQSSKGKGNMNENDFAGMFLHQLQNLYFALCGKELKLKPKK